MCSPNSTGVDDRACQKRMSMVKLILLWRNELDLHRREPFQVDCIRNYADLPFFFQMRAVGAIFTDQDTKSVGNGNHEGWIC